MPIEMKFQNNGTLLDLSDHNPKLTDADIEEIKIAIQAQVGLRALNLSGNALSPSKLKELADWLIKNTEIRQFNVAENTGTDAVLDEIGLSSPKVTVRPMTPEIKIQEAITLKASSEQVWTLEKLQLCLEEDGAVLNLSGQHLYDYDIASLWRFFESNASVFAKLKKINLSNNYLTRQSLRTCSSFWNRAEETAGTQSNITEIDLKGNGIELDFSGVGDLEAMLVNHAKINVWPLDYHAILTTIAGDSLEKDDETTAAAKQKDLDAIDATIKNNFESHYLLAGAILFIYKDAFKNQQYLAAIKLSETFCEKLSGLAALTYENCIQLCRDTPEFSNELIKLLEQESLQQKTEDWFVDNDIDYQQNWQIVAGKILQDSFDKLRRNKDPGAATRLVEKQVAAPLLEFLLPESFRDEMDVFFEKINTAETFAQAMQESLRMSAYLYYTLARLLPTFDSTNIQDKKNIWEALVGFLFPVSTYSKCLEGSEQQQNGRAIFGKMFSTMFNEYLQKRLNDEKSLKQILEDIMQEPPSLDNADLRYGHQVAFISLNLNPKNLESEIRDSMLAGDESSVTTQKNEEFLHAACKGSTVKKSQHYRNQTEVYQQKLKKINAEPEETRDEVERAFIQKEYKTAQGKLFEIKIKSSIETVKEKITNTWGYYFASFFPTPVLNYFYPEPEKLDKLYDGIYGSEGNKNPHEYVQGAMEILHGTEYFRDFYVNIKDEEVLIAHAAARIAFIYQDKIQERKRINKESQLCDITLPEITVGTELTSDDCIQCYLEPENLKHAKKLIEYFEVNKDKFFQLDDDVYKQKNEAWKQVGSAFTSDSTVDMSLKLHVDLNLVKHEYSLVIDDEEIPKNEQTRPTSFSDSSDGHTTDGQVSETSSPGTHGVNPHYTTLSSSDDSTDEEIINRHSIT